MANTTFVSPSAGSIEGFSNRTLENIVGVVGKRLKDEELKLLKKARDDDPLRSLDSVDPDISCFFRRQQQQLYQRIWHDLLQRLRQDLPQALCDLLNDLEDEIRGDGEPASQKDGPASMSPRSATLDFNDASFMDEAVCSLLSKAPVADMGVSSASVRDLARSVTPSPEQPPLANNEPTGVSDTVDDGIPEPPVIQSTTTGYKRPLENTELPRRPKKKARTRRKNYVHHCSGAASRQSIRLNERKPTECVFRYKNYEGFYVLRCNRTRCKDRNGGEMIIFQSYPFEDNLFEDNLAMNHFKGEGHGIKDADEIFHKYARKVLYANKELNLGGTNDHSAIAVAGSADSIVITPPTTPQTSHNKGKQPERRIDLSFQRFAPTAQTSKRPGDDAPEVPHIPTSSTADPSTSITRPNARRTDPSPSTRQKQLGRQPSSFESLFTLSDDEDDLPSPDAILNGTRVRARPDYREKIPDINEFI